MTRVRAIAAGAVALLAGVATGDDAWKATKPAAPVAPPVVVPDVPALPNWPAPKSDGPVWGPAKGGEPIMLPPAQEPAPAPRAPAKPAEASSLQAPRTLPQAAQPNPAVAPGPSSSAVWGGG